MVLRSLSAVLLYLGLSLSANAADLAAAEAALDGSMTKLRFPEAPKTHAFVRFTDFDGNPMSLADYQGKWVVLNFWATWCAPCREEMPLLSELQDEFGGDSFEVVTLATGRNNPAGLIRFFKQIEVDNLPKHLDQKQKVAQSMGVMGLPTTLLIDPQGREVARMQGEADWASDSAKEMVRMLLSGS